MGHLRNLYLRSNFQCPECYIFYTIEWERYKIGNWRDWIWNYYKGILISKDGPTKFIYHQRTPKFI